MLSDANLKIWYKNAIYTKYGEHYLAQYYSHNVQTRMVIAKNRKQLVKLLQNAIEYVEERLGSYDFQIKGVWRIDVKPPTEEHFLERARNTFNAEIDTCKRRILGNAGEYYELTGKLPEGFAICSGYEFNSEKEECTFEEYVDEDMRDYYIQKHLDCKNCFACVTYKDFNDQMFLLNSNKQKVDNTFGQVMPSKAIFGPGLFSGSGIGDSKDIMEVPALIYFDVLEDLGIDFEGITADYKKKLENIEEERERNKESREKDMNKKRIQELEEYFLGLKR